MLVRQRRPGHDRAAWTEVTRTIREAQPGYLESVYPPEVAPGPTDLDVTGLVALTGGKIVARDDGYQIDWDDGDFVRFHRAADRLHFDYLHSSNGEHRLMRLVSALPAFFRAQGIVAFVTSYSGATDAMLKVGFEDAGSHVLVCDIREGGRMDQYSAWKRGEAPEPDWHAAIDREPR